MMMIIPKPDGFLDLSRPEPAIKDNDLKQIVVDAFSEVLRYRFTSQIGKGDYFERSFISNQFDRKKIIDGIERRIRNRLGLPGFGRDTPPHIHSPYNAYIAYKQELIKISQENNY